MPERRWWVAGSANYQRSAPEIRLASAATLSDVDNPNFAGGTLSVSITAGGSAQNRLLFVGSVFTVDSSQRLYYNGLQIGTVNAGGGSGTTPLLFEFNANATAPRVQQLIRSLRFRTAAATNAGDCSIEFAFNDGKQGNATQTIVVSVT